VTSVRCTDRSTLPPRRQTLVLRSVATAAAAAVAISAAFLATAGSASAATPIDLGGAAAFGVLGSTAVTNTGPSTVAGDIGADSGSLTGAGQDPTAADSITLTQGGVNRGNATGGGQAGLTAANTAINSQGSGTNVGATDLSLLTQPMSPGIYSSGSDLALDGPIILDGAGSYDSVFIFRATMALTTAAPSSVVLMNGAQACNVFWQIGSSATLGAGSRFAGNILATTSITLNAGVTVDGRLLASTGAVTLISDVITRSACRTGPVTPPVTTTSDESPTPSGPVPTPVPTGGSGGDGTGTTGRATTYGQVGRVPVGSVDTGDGSTAGLFRGTGTATSADLAGRVWSTR
jgi:hypothetical protein